MVTKVVVVPHGLYTLQNAYNETIYKLSLLTSGIKDIITSLQILEELFYLCLSRINGEMIHSIYKKNFYQLLTKTKYFVENKRHNLTELVANVYKTYQMLPEVQVSVH